MSDIAHPIACKGQKRWNDDGLAITSGHRHPGALPFQLGSISAGEHRMHTRIGKCRTRINRPDQGVGAIGTYEMTAELAR